MMIVLLTLVYSCKDSNHYSSTNYIDDTSQDSLSVEGEAKDFTLNCETYRDCPEFVSHIRINKKKACTGVLIDKDKVLTNAHCISSYNERSSCSNISLYFLKDGKTLERNCVEITKKGFDSNNKSLNFNDYAILKLNAEVKADLISIGHNNSLSERESVKIHTTDSIGSNGAKIRTLENCLNLGVTALSQSRDLWFFNNCNIKGGNSGSPILNYNGNLVGLINMRLVKGNFPLFSRIFDDITTSSHYGIGLNVDCINSRKFSQKSCSRSEDLKKVKSKRLLNQVADKIELLNNRLEDPYVMWNIDLEKLKLVPVCIKNIESLKFEIKEETSNFDYYVQGKREYEYNISFTDFKIRKEIDNDLKLKIKVRNRNALTFNYIKLDMKNYTESGEIDMKLNGSLAGVFEDSHKLRRCDFTIDELTQELRNK